MPKPTPEQRERLADFPGWRGALTILDGFFSDEERDVWRYVHVNARGIEWNMILTVRGWSSTEQLLLEAAESLYDDCGSSTGVLLSKLALWLDDDQWALFLRALTAARGESTGKAIIV